MLLREQHRLAAILLLSFTTHAAEVGGALVLLAAALELVGVWAVSRAAAAAVAQPYQACAGAEPPLTYQVGHETRT